MEVFHLRHQNDIIPIKIKIFALKTDTKMEREKIKKVKM